MHKCAIYEPLMHTYALMLYKNTSRLPIYNNLMIFYTTLKKNFFNCFRCLKKISTFVPRF